MRRNDEDEDKGGPLGQPGPEAVVPSLQLLMDGVVMFMGDVTVESMKPLIDWILAENYSKKKNIYDNINSCTN